MDRQYIRDHSVIERYLRGALTADEEAAFEEAYLGDPAILDELESAERLRQGLQELDNAGGLERSRRKRIGLSALASPQYAAAASVLLAASVVLSGMLYRENRDLRSVEFPRTGQLTRVTPLFAVRGATPNEITAPAEGELTVLQLDPGLADYDRYRAVLERGDGASRAEIWSRSGLLRAELAIALPPSALPPGEYQARLDGRMDEWPAERYDEISRIPFRIVPRD